MTPIDQYQGQGIGAALMRYLVTLAREAGLKVGSNSPPENPPMLQVLKKSGLPMIPKPVAAAAVSRSSSSEG